MAYRARLPERPGIVANGNGARNREHHNERSHPARSGNRNDERQELEHRDDLPRKARDKGKTLERFHAPCAEKSDGCCEIT